VDEPIISIDCIFFSIYLPCKLSFMLFFIVTFIVDDTPRETRAEQRPGTLRVVPVLSDLGNMAQNEAITNGKLTVEDVSVEIGRCLRW
jgi:hypothetical protein